MTSKEYMTAKRSANSAMSEVLRALVLAEKRHPGWPKDMLYAAAIVAEEAGELIQAALDFEAYVGPHNTTNMREEAAQTAAVALRFLIGLDEHEARISLAASQFVEGSVSDLS